MTALNRLAIESYDFIIRIEEVAGFPPPDTAPLVRQWLTIFGELDDASEELRTRVSEARWMLLPASEAFNHPKMVALRDAAIDEMRAKAKQEGNR